MKFYEKIYILLQSVVQDGNSLTELYQMLSTKQYSLNQILPEVMFEINCTYPIFVLPKEVVSINEGGVSIMGKEFFNLTLNIYLTSNFSNPLESNGQVSS